MAWEQEGLDAAHTHGSLAITAKPVRTMKPLAPLPLRRKSASAVRSPARRAGKTSALRIFWSVLPGMFAGRALC